MRRAVRRAAVAVGQVVLPPLCPLCRVGDPGDGVGFCSTCTPGLERLSEPFCTVCALPFGGAGPSHPCARCHREPPPFEAARAWGPYAGGLLQSVQRLKYGQDLALRRALVGLFVEAYDRFELPEPQAVVPVPCHRRALRRRGFDLPALLSRGLCRRRSLVWRPRALARAGPEVDLVGLGAAARARAVAGAFRPRERLAGDVLLVDDVITTTATARACARACLAAGARRVHVLALARTARAHP
ncbi:MAG: ComF family protein [Deferrisomatales bacterium]